MRVEELVLNYISGGNMGQASGGRLRIEGDDLINYSTVIATRDNNGEIILNGERYSRSTTRHQNVIRRRSEHREILFENRFNEIRAEIILNKKGMIA